MSAIDVPFLSRVSRSRQWSSALYCSRFLPHQVKPAVPSQQVGPKNLSSRLGACGFQRPRSCRRRRRASAPGEGARPRQFSAPGPGPRWGPFRTDRGGSRDGGVTPRLCKALAQRPRHGGLHPGQGAPVVLVRCGHRSGPTAGGSRDGGLTPRTSAEVELPKAAPCPVFGRRTAAWTFRLPVT